MKKQGLYAGLTALMIMFFSFSASAATMTVDYGTMPSVKFQVDSTSYHVGAGEFQVTFDWHEMFDFDIAYCVDVNNTISNTTYQDVTLNPITTDSGNYLHAAWLMDKWSADASVNANKTAGLQLAIWHAIYGDWNDDSGNGFLISSNTSGSISQYYSDYYQDANDNEFMWSSLGYHYAYTTYGEGINAQSLLVQMNPVPEPGTMLLLGMGIAGLGAAGRKRFRKQ
jgi:hypothetical protein